MRVILVVLAVLLAGCSNSSPTAPSPITVTPPVVVTPPPVVTPPVIPPPPDLLTDPRFNRAFYQQFVHNTHERPGILEPLRRQTEAPRIYLRTLYDSGTPVDAASLDSTAQALINTTGLLTGVFGLAGLERGTETREGQRGWITVRWSERTDRNACGTAAVGGDLIMLYPRNNCRCAGHPSSIGPVTVKHELGHALGYWHTDSVYDLMYFQSLGECDKIPSEREIFHARVAYAMPNGSLEP